MWLAAKSTTPYFFKRHMETLKKVWCSYLSNYYCPSKLITYSIYFFYRYHLRHMHGCLQNLFLNGVGQHLDLLAKVIHLWIIIAKSSTMPSTSIEKWGLFQCLREYIIAACIEFRIEKEKWRRKVEFIALMLSKPWKSEYDYSYPLFKDFHLHCQNPNAFISFLSFYCKLGQFYMHQRQHLHGMVVTSTLWQCQKMAMKLW